MGWSGRAHALRASDAGKGLHQQEMPKTASAQIAVIGIDIGKNSFHVVGHDKRGSIVLRQKWSRGQIEARLANMPPCLIGMEACVGAHHLDRKLSGFGHDARLMPAKYVRSYAKGQKNDFNDAEAIAEAVQRPTMKFVATKTAISSTCRLCIGCASGWQARAREFGIQRIGVLGRPAPLRWANPGGACNAGRGSRPNVP